MEEAGRTLEAEAIDIEVGSMELDITGIVEPTITVTEKGDGVEVSVLVDTPPSDDALGVIKKLVVE